MMKKMKNCTYTLKMSPDRENVQFNVEVVISGVFSYDKHDDKKEVHVEVSRRLFPYLQSTTSALMAVAGLPNFVIPENELRVEDVTV
jgi:preprotein translocase subunit SecB